MTHTGGRAILAARPRGFGMRASRLTIASLVTLAIGAAAYIAAPILDERIPFVFRHIDWVSYERAATRFVDGQPLYIAAQLAGPYQMANIAGLGYVYPPPSILLFVPFLTLGAGAWTILNSLLFASGIGAMAVRDFGRYAALAFGIALLATSITAPYLDAMVMGNVNLGLAGLFAWTWALGRGSRPIGWIAGFAGVIKLHPFALAGWTRLPEARRTIGIAVAVAVVVALVTLPVVGIGSWIDYQKAAANARPLCGYGIDAVACALVPALGGLATPVLLAVAGLLIVIAILSRSDILSFALIVIALLAAHPEVFTHTFLLVEVLVFAIACSVARWRLVGGNPLAPAAEAAR